MTEVLIFAFVMIWLGLAGWSYRIMAEDLPRDSVGFLFVVCLLLAPFTAAATLADNRIRAAKEDK
jgi:hypothetical protein